MDNKIQKREIKSLLNSDAFKTAISQMLPEHLTADRMARVAISALGKNPKLAQCTPESIIDCMMTLSQVGLEPDGRNAHLIPYGKTCTLIIDYKGLVELVMRTGTVSNINAQIVCKNDVFETDKGQIIVHRIDYTQPRGDMYAVYCEIEMKDGTTHTEILTREEVDHVRSKSKASESGPWVSDFAEMAKKTAFRRATKWVSLSSQAKIAIAANDKEFTK
jgi:recombination protein RecT